MLHEVEETSWAGHDDIGLALEAGNLRALSYAAVDGDDFQTHALSKYNRPGGKVKISLRQEDGTVLVEVADTGYGIPGEHLERLFQRFYRVDSARSRSTGGAGLGLAICKSFLEAHEGTIHVESVPEEGTTFTVKLPLER